MDTAELKQQLERLIDRYVEQETERTRLLQLVRQKGTPPVKAILAKITSSPVTFDPQDSDVVKDIVFYYV